MIKILPGWMRKWILNYNPKINFIKYRLKSNRKEVDFSNLKSSVAELKELVSPTKTTCYENLGKKAIWPNYSN